LAVGLRKQSLSTSTMAWAPLLLTLLAHCTAAATLGIVPSYQQRPGSALTTVIYKDDERPSEVPARFSGSIDTSSSAASLTISGLKPKDEADYCCQSGYDSSKNTVLQTHEELRLPEATEREKSCLGAAQLQPRSLRRAAFTMAWTPLLLVLLSQCTGSLSQPVLTQPSSLSVSLGASARLTCTLSSGFKVGDFWIRWHQQKPGNPPRYLLTFHSDSDKHQGSGVPSRVSGSSDASANAGLLLISGLQPEDEADYYCATYHGNSKAFTVLLPQGKARQKPPLCSVVLTKVEGCSTFPSIEWALRTAQTEPHRHSSVLGQRP
ncbi:Immunoglobulin lambda variable 5-52, partial [Camelus dromedarius]